MTSHSTIEPADTDLTFAARGSAAVITITRPRALNALTDGMRARLAAAFPGYARSPDVYAVVLKSAVPKAFSVGADVREALELARRDVTAARRSFADEYRLNWLLECFSKPTVSLIDGMVMGGGVGISQYGTHKVGGDLYKFAMPETVIGFFPDVGMAHVLGRLPGEIGTYLGLTGRSIGRSDAYALGLLTHCIPATRYEEIEASLADTQTVDPLLDRMHVDPGPTELLAHATGIASWFSASTVEDIVARLDSAAGPSADFARGIAADLAKRSPVALKVTLRHLRQAKRLDLRQTLEQDYRLVVRFIEGFDFSEGVRAALIDKGSTPKWQHARLQNVSEAEVDRYFDTLGADELRLPLRAEMQAARV